MTRCKYNNYFEDFPCYEKAIGTVKITLVTGRLGYNNKIKVPVCKLHLEAVHKMYREQYD